MKRMNMNAVGRWICDMLAVCKREFALVFRDMGVVLFFLLLPTVYPILYALIYNPEYVREVPVVVVDDCRSDMSREYARRLDASQYVKIVGYAANMQEARKCMAEKECYAIVNFPEDFSRCIGRGEQAHVSIYSDMSLLLRYKGILMAATDVQAAMGADVRAEVMQQAAASGTAGIGMIPTIDSASVAMGNTAMGLASALLPGILVLILQQSLILGVCMLAAGSRERARLNGGIDPKEIRTGDVRQMLGKALCYLVIYIIPLIYILKYVPMIFSYPQNGHSLDMIAFMVPFLLSSIFMGMTIQVFIREREAVFPLFVFTSVLFLFLSGLSWPRFAMSGLWYLIGSCFPSTWAMNGYIAMKSNGALLHQVSHPYVMLWLLTAIYFLLALAVRKFVDKKQEHAGMKN